MKSNPQAEILRRLHCAAGHLNAVIRMTETGQSCEQVLHQLNAVQSALSAVGIRIVRRQAQSSQDVILNSASFNERADEIKRLQSLYGIFIQHFNQTSEVTHD